MQLTFAVSNAFRWCHRIFPVQSTCRWTKEDVRSNVVVLVKQFIEGHVISSNNVLKVLLLRTFYISAKSISDSSSVIATGVHFS